MRVELTHSEKVYFPAARVTKGDVFDYYQRVANKILPYLKDRPLSLQRYPEGLAGEGFFQKNFEPGSVPNFVKLEKIYAESTDEDVNYVVCNDRLTLDYLVNFGCIEINPWLSRVGRLKHPDYLVLDLDPEDLPFVDVIKTAKIAKRYFDDRGLPSFVKTSGARGLHMWLPLDGRSEFHLAHQLAQNLAASIAKLAPWTSIERSPEKRHRKIYLDVGQNNFAQTVVAPWSLRPQPQATVSTPLDWRELNPLLDPKDFTIKTVKDRLERADPWLNFRRRSIDVAATIKRLSI